MYTLLLADSVDKQWFLLPLGQLWCFPNPCVFLVGPVEIGMSLDIASIDAISEINMVLTFCSQCVLGTDPPTPTDWMTSRLLHVHTSGLHCHHLPPPAVARLQAGLPGEREHQHGRAPGVAALDPRHVHPRLQALLPARRDGGEPPDTHLQQRHRPVRPPVRPRADPRWFTYCKRSHHPEVDFREFSPGIKSHRS